MRVYLIPLIIDDNTLKNIDYPYYVRRERIYIHVANIIELK